MSFGKLTAAAVSGTLETTVALASLNFDFSLVRVEAPLEYRELGMALSPARSEEAETGMSHITARKLAALFQELVPPTPNLFRAYGLRASEIVKSPKYNPKPTKADGIFADQVGADGTTIWAAATSGTAAIAMHLLACMLARIWSGPEAISIWAELVTGRKELLAKTKDGDALNAPGLAASRIHLSREQLARWDASARAWLATADEANELRQKQLLLIIHNLGIPVTVQGPVYERVINSWITAMTAMESFVAGMSQTVHIGAPLLGLSAWHLYPDMLVLGNAAKKIEQNDPLIAPGSLITLGIKSTDRNSDGIFWSLPLAHLRFYGDPVVSTNSVGTHTARISISQLLQVALGGLVESWCANANDFYTAMQLLTHMQNTLKQVLKADELESSWLSGLAKAAQSFLDATGPFKAECIQLIRSGRRRYGSFLKGSSAHSLSSKYALPAFGFTNCVTILRFMRNNETRIKFLRAVAASLQDRPARLVIQYSVDSGVFECASVFPLKSTKTAKKRKRSAGVADFKYCHQRWTRLHSAAVPNNPRDPEFEYPSVLDADSAATGRAEQLLSLGEKVAFLQKPIPSFKADSGCRWVEISAFLEYQAKSTSDYLDDIFQPSQSGELSVKMHFLLGDPESAAIYAVQDAGIDSVKTVSLELTDRAFKDDLIDPSKFMNHLSRPNHNNTSIGPDYRPYRSLRALATTMKVYKDLPQAKVSLQVASDALSTSKWLPEDPPDVNTMQPYELNLRQLFACIIMFESGSFNIEPGSLSSVMAVSTGNSLYIPTQLLTDPWEVKHSCQLRRVVGNIGRSGIALIIPPQNPKIKQLDHDSWTLINHNEFDGKLDDCFRDTSLHLTMSDWELPIDLGDQSRGLRDKQIYFVEAPVSILSRGEWVGDVDILKSLCDPKLCHVGDCSDASYGPMTCKEGIPKNAVSIDSWEELIENPLEPGIVRAHRNWQARLAAAALSIQRGHPTCIVAEKVCWQCCAEALKSKAVQMEDKTQHVNASDSEMEAIETSASSWEFGEYDFKRPRTSINISDNGKTRDALKKDKIFRNTIYII